MTILQIAVLSAFAFFAGRLPKGRQLFMLAVSAFAIFWLQPAEPFVSLRFWLPVGTLGITALTWALTTVPGMRAWKDNWPAALILVGITVLMSLGRYVKLEGLLPSPVPSPLLAVLVVLAIAASVALLACWGAASRFWRMLLMLGVIALFIVLKSPLLSQSLIHSLAGIRGEAQSSELAPLTWLGYSYLAFRLLHTIRDRQSGRLPPVTLAEYANYAVFFPAFTSGPIDRLERFVNDLRNPLPLCDEDVLFAGRRLVSGLFKKFVVADLLAVISINDALVSRVQGAGWLWLFLYAYAFRIYFDFSGYTDLAIGMGRLMGVRLPENFTSPYLKPNITQFWNSWHITLTQWVRAYVFNPLSRSLRASKRHLPVWLIILVAQLVTMLLIGLWHGIAWGFVCWGLWHAAGLFVHNRWTEFTRDGLPGWSRAGAAQRALGAAGVFITFNYVAVGWLFFTLSAPAVAWQAIQKLFGLQ